MEELLFARNAGIDSACRRCETGKALDEGGHSANRSIKFRSFQTEFMPDLTPQIGLITCLAYNPP